MAATRIAGTTSTTSSAPTPSGLPTRAEVMPQAQSENFTVASLLLSRPQRRALLGIYGFARLVDDIGDETTGDREAMLDWLEDDVDRMFSGAADPSAAAPARAVRRASSAFRGAVPAPDRREPAGSGGVALRDLRRAGRLLRPVGEPRRRARAVHVRRGHARADRAVGLASAPGCSSPSTGRTSARTTAAAGSTCRRRTSSASASRRTSWLRNDPDERLQDLLAFEVERGRRLLDAGRRARPLAARAAPGRGRRLRRRRARRVRRDRVVGLRRAACARRRRRARRAASGPPSTCCWRRDELRLGLRVLPERDAAARRRTSTTASACCRTERRGALCAVYAFARRVDDIGDGRRRPTRSSGALDDERRAARRRSTTA